MADTEKNTVAILIKALALCLRPLVINIGTPTEPDKLPEFLEVTLEAAGITLDNTLGEETVAAVWNALTAVSEAYDAIAPIIEREELPSLAELKQLATPLKNAFNAIKALSALELKAYETDEVLVEIEDFGRVLLDYLITDYLQQQHPPIFSLLALFGIIEFGNRKADNLMERLTRIRFDFLGELVRDPNGAIGGIYGWGSEAFDAGRLFVPLAFFLHGLDFSAQFAYPNQADGEALGWDSDAIEPDMELRLPLMRTTDIVTTQAGFSLLPLRNEEGKPDGLALVPYGVGTTSQTIDLGQGWEFEYLFSGAVSGRFGVVTRFGEGVAIRSLEDGGDLPANITLRSLAALRSTAAARERKVLLGHNNLGSIDIGKVNLQLGFEYANGKASYFVELPLEDIQFVFNGANADGFLKKVLPSKELQSSFDLTVGWASKGGFYFRGDVKKSDFRQAAGLRGGKTETSVASREKRSDPLGSIKLDSIDTALDKKDDAVTGMFASTVTVKLGPITAVVEKMGVEARLTFPDEGGNLWLANLELGFKPPNGAALAIDAAAVKGGGYLFFDPAKEQYAGIMELELGGKIALKAIGLITTRMPDGSAGFSLFALITAEGFAPIQLGMGFTLNGIGGLLGLNRTVMTEVLRQGLKKNTLDSILFPSDPIRNAPTIISNLSAVFPPAADRFLFGPMAIIGWGTPTLLTLKVAVLLEIPDPVRLIILGRLSVMLPDPAHPIVRIQLDAIGELNFQKGTVSLDGALFDSRLLEFTLTGSMALRASWGDQPYFLLSIGGFNPRFPVPAGLPQLDRLALSLSSSENLRLRLEGYLALTSNTAQFGARLEVFAKAGAISLDGYLGFDTLIQFSPFGFIADVAAGVALRYNDKLIAGIYLALVIAGPTPWHIRGTAKIELLFLSYTVDIDHRFGPAAPPPLPEPIDVGARLRLAFQDPGNWSSRLPGAEHPLVTLRAVEGEGLMAHPLSQLAVRQQVVPLNFAIARYGTATPTQERYFTIQVNILDSSLSVEPEPVEEFFAIGQFRNLSEDEKLRRPSFEKMEAGFQFATDEYGYDLALGLESPIEYETMMVDPAAEIVGAAQSYALSATALEHLAVEGAAGQCDFRSNGHQ